MLECTRRGWECRDVTHSGFPSRRSPHRVTNDFLGFIDLLAAKDGCGYGIQFTGGSGGNFAARRRKILTHENLAFARALGLTILLWGWQEKGGRAVLREEVIE